MTTPNKPSIFTLGYSGWRVEDIESTVHRLNAILVDVRMVPRSREPIWNGTTLHKRLGDRYVWLKEFGNRNYRGTVDQIEIADFPAGQERLAKLLGLASASTAAGVFDPAIAPTPTGATAPGLTSTPPTGRSVILLCGCPDVNQCHRKVLADWLAQSWQAQVIHLTPPKPDRLTHPDNKSSGHQPTLF